MRVIGRRMRCSCSLYYSNLPLLHQVAARCPPPHRLWMLDQYRFVRRPPAARLQVGGQVSYLRMIHALPCKSVSSMRSKSLLDPVHSQTWTWSCRQRVWPLTPTNPSLWFSIVFPGIFFVFQALSSSLPLRFLFPSPSGFSLSSSSEATRRATRARLLQLHESTIARCHVAHRTWIRAANDIFKRDSGLCTAASELPWTEPTYVSCITTRR